MSVAAEILATEVINEEVPAQHRGRDGRPHGFHRVFRAAVRDQHWLSESSRRPPPRFPGRRDSSAGSHRGVVRLPIGLLLVRCQLWPRAGMGLRGVSQLSISGPTCRHSQLRTRHRVADSDFFSRCLLGRVLREQILVPQPRSLAQLALLSVAAPAGTAVGQTAWRRTGTSAEQTAWRRAGTSAEQTAGRPARRTGTSTRISPRTTSGRAAAWSASGRCAAPCASAGGCSTPGKPASAGSSPALRVGRRTVARRLRVSARSWRQRSERG